MVAFDVRLMSHKRNLATKAKVIFETVDLNEGLGYDASSGIFTAPSGGLYVFDWTILTWDKLYAYTSLVVNDQEKSWSLCRSSAAKLTIVRLKEGDKVWIKNFHGQGDIHAQYTSFSGFKL
uniref:Cerebellin-3 n=1 Tax=Magallana gigas TaxID=29159 RepID=K1QMG6_MAGGI